MQVHILLQKINRPDGFVSRRAPEYSYEPLASVELEVVPKGYYVVEGVTYQTVGIPKFIIDSTRDGHTLNHVEIRVEAADTEDLWEADYKAYNDRKNSGGV